MYKIRLIQSKLSHAVKLNRSFTEAESLEASLVGDNSSILISNFLAHKFAGHDSDKNKTHSLQTGL